MTKIQVDIIAWGGDIKLLFYPPPPPQIVVKLDIPKTNSFPIFQPPTLTFFIGNYSTLIIANDPINFYTEFG